MTSSQCIMWCAWILPDFAGTSTHCTCPQMEGQAELTWVADYILLGLLAHIQLPIPVENITHSPSIVPHSFTPGLKLTCFTNLPQITLPATLGTTFMAWALRPGLPSGLPSWPWSWTRSSLLISCCLSCFVLFYCYRSVQQTKWVFGRRQTCLVVCMCWHQLFTTKPDGHP